MVTRIPIAENDKFAIWRIGGGQSHDLVLHKETGRWLAASATSASLGLPSDPDRRQQALIETARDLDLELTDGSPAIAPEGPGLGM